MGKLGRRFYCFNSDLFRNGKIVGVRIGRADDPDTKPDTKTDTKIVSRELPKYHLPSLFRVYQDPDVIFYPAIGCGAYRGQDRDKNPFSAPDKKSSGVDVFRGAKRGG